jgi:hypothetical protein
MSYDSNTSTKIRLSSKTYKFENMIVDKSEDSEECDLSNESPQYR